MTNTYLNGLPIPKINNGNLLMNNFSPVVNPNYLRFVTDSNDKIIAFALAFPGIGKAMQTRGGRLTPLTIIRLLHAVHHPKTIDLGLVGVLPEAALGGSQIEIFKLLSQQIIDDKIEYVETNLNLEDNTEIISMWDHFNSVQHKRRRSFVKKI